MDQTAVMAIAEARGVTRDFRGGGVVHALRGRSGSGKTTLLNILIGLDDPTEGQVFILEQDLARLGETERARLRRESIGMMFQIPPLHWQSPLPHRPTQCSNLPKM